jgi:membrane-associated phospholipid phosphatase
MRRTPVALGAVAAAAVAAGIAVPTLATASSSSPVPPGVAEAASPGSGQSVIDWNRTLITILGTPGVQPAAVHPTRSFALLQAAEHDAVASITHRPTPYGRPIPAPADARPDAAADQAAHDVLAGLYPSMRTALDTQLAGELAALPGGQPTADGERVGAAAAQQLLALRSADGSSAEPPPFVPGTGPGDYRPTPPKFAAPMYQTWGGVTPFALTDPGQFRPDVPPSVSSPAYAAALDEVESLGRDTSTTRTADQTVAGRFWSSVQVWTTWNQVTQQLLTDRHASLARATTVFSSLDLALADTTIAMYDAKYHWRIWRPVTAIQLGGTAGNPAIVGDPTWNPLTPTAADPSYPGAHSAISEAAATVLTAYSGTSQPVTVTSAADPGVTRSFISLAQAADEAGLSRIWAGQHTRLDHQAGQRLGQQVARFVLGQRWAQQPDAG